MALAFPDAVESEHMSHPDFRVGGNVFASLGYPNDDWAMIRLLPGQQSSYVAANADSFKPCNGAWGQRGYTNVRLASVEESVVNEALEAAFKNATGQLG